MSEPLPDGGYTGAFIGAYRKGFVAGRDRQSYRNPYGDARTVRGSVTFARGFRRAWGAGYKAGASAPTETKEREP